MHASHLRSIAIGMFVLAAIVGLSAFAAMSQKASAATSIEAGDLIRGETFSAVYYMGADGFRYVFVNEKTFFTWYDNFDDVVFITDEELGQIQICGNVTYKPGSKMIKINTDPKVYYVDEGGSLYWVSSESLATEMYGSNWNQQIDDVPDGFFSNYTITGDEAVASMADESFTDHTINEDKGLVAPEEIVIDADGFSPIDVTVDAGATVRFTNEDSERHTATADDGSWGTGTILPGGTFVVRFEEAGTYTFYDGYDNSNTGAVYVE